MTKVKQRGIGVRESLFNTVLLYVEVPRNQKNKLIKSCNNAILPHNHKHKSGIIIDLYLKIYSNFFAFKNFIWVIIYFACKSVWFAAIPDRHYTVIFFLTVYLYISNELVQRAATSLLWKHLSSHQALDTQHVLYGSLFRCPLVYFVSQTTRLRRLASVGLQCPWGPSWLIFVSSKITEEYLILLARWKLVQYPNSMLRTDRNILKLKDKWAELLNRRLHFFLYVFSLNDMLLSKIMLFIIVFRFRNIFQAWRSGSSTLEH